MLTPSPKSLLMAIPYFAMYGASRGPRLRQRASLFANHEITKRLIELRLQKPTSINNFLMDLCSQSIVKLDSCKYDPRSKRFQLCEDFPCTIFLSSYAVANRCMRRQLSRSIYVPRLNIRPNICFHISVCLILSHKRFCRFHTDQSDFLNISFSILAFSFSYGALCYEIIKHV